MEILSFSFNAVVPLLLQVALGFLLRARGLIRGADVRMLSKLTFSVFLPTMIFVNIASIDFRAEFSPRLMVFTLCGIAAMVVGLYLLLKPLASSPTMHAALVHTVFRSNFLLLGIPLVGNMFGDEGVRIASMLIPIAIIPFNMVAVVLMSTASADHSKPPKQLIKSTLWEIVKNPLIIACVLGTVFSVAEVQLPGWLQSPVNGVAGIASPFALIVLGAQLELRSLRENVRMLLLATGLRLVVVPLAMMAAAALAGFRGAELGALFVLFASPCATSIAVMARVYNVEPSFSAQMVVFTTVLCGFTLFAGISLLRFLQLF